MNRSRAQMFGLVVVSLFMVVLTSLLFTGNRSYAESVIKEEVTAPLDFESVIRIATIALDELNQLSPSYCLCTSKDPDENWLVRFERQPATPGGHTIVTVSNLGKVIRVSGGR